MVNLANKKRIPKGVIVTLSLVIWLGGGVMGKSRQDSKTRDTVKGNVVTKDAKRPVKNALVYNVKGEEETLTNEKGEFVIGTWRSVPFDLYVDIEGFILKKVIIQNTSESISILLESK